MRGEESKEDINDEDEIRKINDALEGEIDVDKSAFAIKKTRRGKCGASLRRKDDGRKTKWH